MSKINYLFNFNIISKSKIIKIRFIENKYRNLPDQNIRRREKNR